ncbi:hypothetical protein KK421_17640 [Clostridioides difficile]|nr:hypothetical protein [Clostridioides difficile]MBT2158470.1 hypothetical protein [Clostridioides difficile]
MMEIIQNTKIRDEGQNDRENKYQTLINDLIDSLKVIGKIYKEIKTLKNIRYVLSYNLLI